MASADMTVQQIAAAYVAWTKALSETPGAVSRDKNDAAKAVVVGWQYNCWLSCVDWVLFASLSFPRAANVVPLFRNHFGAEPWQVLLELAKPSVRAALVEQPALLVQMQVATLRMRARLLAQFKTVW